MRLHSQWIAVALFASTACTDAPPDPPEDTRPRAWTSAANELEILHTGGGGPQPAGSECVFRSRRIVLSATDMKIVAATCESPDPASTPYRWDSTARAITQADIVQLQDVLATLRVVQNTDDCYLVVDGSVTILKIATPSGAIEYQDSTQDCPGESGPFVDTEASIAVETSLSNLYNTR